MDVRGQKSGWSIKLHPLFCFRSPSGFERFGLRFATVGAKRASTGRTAPSRGRLDLICPGSPSGFERFGLACRLGRRSGYAGSSTGRPRPLVDAENDRKSVKKDVISGFICKKWLMLTEHCAYRLLQIPILQQFFFLNSQPSSFFHCTTKRGQSLFLWDRWYPRWFQVAPVCTSVKVIRPFIPPVQRA